MGRTKKESTPSHFVPASSPEAKEAQMIHLAEELAAQQLRDGTASSQVITHYLKLGTTKERLEREKLEEENKLLRAKTKAYESAEDIKQMYSAALNAMKIYSGQDVAEEEDDGEDL